MRSSNQITVPATLGRMCVKGKFLFTGHQKFYIKGVTYGTFAPQPDGTFFPEPILVASDFAQMAAHGFNTVRTYTVPPIWLLDIAHECGLKIMIGLPWAQHSTFLDGAKQKKIILDAIKEGVVGCKKHPAILCYSIGNEIPAAVVRWYGKKKTETFLKTLYTTVKEIDPHGLVTYVNYPTTEYLDLPFLDFVCFNVYLETPEKLDCYIARLHNLSGDRPLVLAEIGLDSQRNGLAKQAEVLQWQLSTSFGKGCAGMFVFAWTDEWWRGGFAIEDWDFGLVTRDRVPKPALHAVQKMVQQIPIANTKELPFISVVVCSYNGSATIRDCLNSLQKLHYPYYEVLVINDGSTDELPTIVAGYSVKLITTKNAGLSSARNTGLAQARGEIVAYIDDDAYADPAWLQYMAYMFCHTTHACIGGPNVIPPDDGMIAQCVAQSPGGPVHVLLDDELAEHVPGCNMSFRKQALVDIGGFDPAYRIAGDDVDICWRLQKAGYTIGFHPAALVWHHRRNSLKAYWKQQKNYGKSEALLEAKWPEKYNGLGHLSWRGRMYGAGITEPILLKNGKIFYGTWGLAPFQSIYQPAAGFFRALPLMPEWYLLSVLFFFFGSLGFLWFPLLWSWLLFILSISIVVVQAALNAERSDLKNIQAQRRVYAKLLIATLYILQPLARLYGRLQQGLTPWRQSGHKITRSWLRSLWPQLATVWPEHYQTAEQWLEQIEANVIESNTRIRRGGAFDRWDLQAVNSLFCKCHSLLLVEQIDNGGQALHLRMWALPSKLAVAAAFILSSLIFFTLADDALAVAVILSVLLASVAAAYLHDAASTLSDLHDGFKKLIQSKEMHPATVVQMKQVMTEANVNGASTAIDYKTISQEVDASPVNHLFAEPTINENTNVAG